GDRVRPCQRAGRSRASSASAPRYRRFRERADRHAGAAGATRRRSPHLQTDPGAWRAYGEDQGRVFTEDLSLRSAVMEIGFIGLGRMGGPMSRRLIEAGHQVTVFDARKDAMDKLVKAGATAARSVADVADRVETVMTSLPSLNIGFEVACGENGLTRGNR